MAKRGRVEKAPATVVLTREGEAEIERTWQGGGFEGFRYYAENYLQIRTAETNGVWEWAPFVLNDEQEHFARLFIGKLQRRERIRFFVLKGRKMGFTTLINGIGMWLGGWVPGWKTKTVAQLDDSVVEIFQIAIGMNERLDPAVHPFLGARAMKGRLQWANGSSVQVETQRSETKSRGGSPSLLHLSEFCHWQTGRGKGAVERVLASMLGSLEQGGGGGAAAVVIETTANGIGGPGYERWQETQKEGSDWVGLFYEWQRARKYQFPDETPAMASVTALVRGKGTREQKIAKLMAEPWIVREVDHCKDKRMTAEMAGERAVDFELTGGQVGFMFRNIGELGSLDMFDQEFPLSAEMAFVSAGGRQVFDTPTQRTVRLGVVAPKCRRGLLRDVPYVPESEELSERESWDGIRWFTSASQPGDAWWLWAPPAPGWVGRYGVGIDASNGAGKDNGAIEVVDYLTGEQVAQFYSSTSTADVLAEQAMFIGRWYGNALLVPEINGPGNVVVKDVWKANYPNVFRRTAAVWDRAAAQRPDVWSTELGVYMEERARQIVINGITRAVRDGVTKIRSSRTATEISTFRFDATGRPDHIQGAYSDSILGLGLAEYGRDQAGVMRRTAGAMASDEDETSVGSRLRRRRPERQSQWFGNRK